VQLPECLDEAAEERIIVELDESVCEAILAALGPDGRLQHAVDLPGGKALAAYAELQSNGGDDGDALRRVKPGMRVTFAQVPTERRVNWDGAVEALERELKKLTAEGNVPAETPGAARGKTFQAHEALDPKALVIKQNLELLRLFSERGIPRGLDALRHALTHVKGTLARAFKFMDFSRTGEICLSEFSTGLEVMGLDVGLLTGLTVKAAFRALNASGGGALSLSDLEWPSDIPLNKRFLRKPATKPTTTTKPAGESKKTAKPPLEKTVSRRRSLEDARRRTTSPADTGKGEVGRGKVAKKTKGKTAGLTIKTEDLGAGGETLSTAGTSSTAATASRTPAEEALGSQAAPRPVPQTAPAARARERPSVHSDTPAGAAGDAGRATTPATCVPLPRVATTDTGALGRFRALPPEQRAMLLAFEEAAHARQYGFKLMSYQDFASLVGSVVPEAVRHRATMRSAYETALQVQIDFTAGKHGRAVSAGLAFPSLSVALSALGVCHPFGNILGKMSASYLEHAAVVPGTWIREALSEHGDLEYFR